MGIFSQVLNERESHAISTSSQQRLLPCMLRLSKSGLLREGPQQRISLRARFGRLEIEQVPDAILLRS